MTEIQNPNPHNLTFPYPQQGGAIRKAGNGCLDSCVHRAYCPAVYWFNRYGQIELTPTMGTRCLSWSNDPNDHIDTWTANDYDENDYMYIQGIGSEATRNGITMPTTGPSYP